MKHCRDAKLSRQVKQLVRFLRRLDAELHLQSVLYYLAEVCGDRENVQTFLQSLLQELPEKEEAIMTYGQQLRQQGRQEGVQQGMQKGMQQGMQQGLRDGKRSVAENMLLRGLSETVVAECTGFALVEVQAIKKAIEH